MIFTYIYDFSQNMVQNDPAKKKLLGSKVEILPFLLGNSVQGLFVDPKTIEGVGMKARGCVTTRVGTRVHGADQNEFT
jgi:hypothetical protein